MCRNGLPVVDLSPRAALLVMYEPAYVQHSAYLLIHIAAHIADAKSHAFQALGIGIPQFTGREPCAPVFLKQLIQPPVEDERGRFH